MENQEKNHIELLKNKMLNKLTHLNENKDIIINNALQIYSQCNINVFISVAEYETEIKQRCEQYSLRDRIFFLNSNVYPLCKIQNKNIYDMYEDLIITSSIELLKEYLGKYRNTELIRNNNMMCNKILKNSFVKRINIDEHGQSNIWSLSNPEIILYFSSEMSLYILMKKEEIDEAKTKGKLQLIRYI